MGGWLGRSGWVIPSAQATDGFLLGLQGVEFRNASLSLVRTAYTHRRGPPHSIPIWEKEGGQRLSKSQAPIYNNGSRKAFYAEITPQHPFLSEHAKFEKCRDGILKTFFFPFWLGNWTSGATAQFDTVKFSITPTEGRNEKEIITMGEMGGSWVFRILSLLSTAIWTLETIKGHARGGEGGINILEKCMGKTRSAVGFVSTKIARFLYYCFEQGNARMQ